jgi:dsRNA-specific ribonuclease
VLFRVVSEEVRKDGVFFVSEVLVNGEVCGTGEGFSKRESQQKAARQALSKLK